jgi:hypothetical protein
MGIRHFRLLTLSSFLIAASAHTSISSALQGLRDLCGMTSSLERAARGDFEKFKGELGIYRNWSSVPHEGKNAQMANRPFPRIGRPTDSSSSLIVDPKLGTLRARFPANASSSDTADLIRRLGLAARETKQSEGSTRMIAPVINLKRANEIEADFFPTSESFQVLDKLHASAAKDSLEMLREAKLNIGNRRELRKWFELHYQKPSGLSFNEVFPPPYATDKVKLTDDQIEMADNLIAAGFIDDPYLKYDQGPTLSNEVFVNRLIEARWQKVGSGDFFGGGERMQAAQRMWASLGNPILSPDVMKRFIDPILTKAPLKKPASVSQEVFNTWKKLRAEQDELFPQMRADADARNYDSPTSLRYRAIGKQIDEIEVANLDLRRADRMAEPMPEDQITERLDLLVSETFGYALRGVSGENRKMRAGYENMSLQESSRDRRFRAALAKEFKRLYYDEAMDLGPELDDRLVKFTTDWFYPN